MGSLEIALESSCATSDNPHWRGAWTRRSHRYTEKGYLHHGIYTVGRHVIHYGGPFGVWRRGSVEEVPITEFSRGRPIFIVHGEPTTFDRLEVIRRARSRVGKNLYQLLTNNCEHFCEWCLRGEHRSYQVEARVDFPNGVMRTIGRLRAGYAHHDFQSVWQNHHD